MQSSTLVQSRITDGNLELSFYLFQQLCNAYAKAGHPILSWVNLPNALSSYIPTWYASTDLTKDVHINLTCLQLLHQFSKPYFYQILLYKMQTATNFHNIYSIMKQMGLEKEFEILIRKHKPHFSRHFPQNQNTPSNQSENSSCACTIM